ncbi:MAG: HAMP domain-containing histidine kinase [Gramella sp.]|nr:HAMP domain-containing histidine kinase [Christiangramia sp.]
MKTASKIIRDSVPEIMETWELRVKDEIPASRMAKKLVLRNQLPNILEDISDILERAPENLIGGDLEQYKEVIKNSLEHGRHRANSSHYTIQQILSEYIIFHRVVTEILMTNNVYSKEVGLNLKYTLETAMLTSAGSFNDSLQEMREKLIGTLIHDIRNPISAAYFALDVIDSSTDRKRIENLKKMGMRSLNKTLDLVEGLLDAISIRAGEGMVMNFSKIDLVKEIRSIFNEASEIYSHEIYFESEEEEVFGIFDGTAIRRVVENLVNNAVKYGSANSRISIFLESALDEVIIKVHNFGNPIGESSQSKIFKFLNRSHQPTVGNAEGWGMGLTLVQSVAMAHGGKVDLQSSKEEGTTFSFSLKKKYNKPGKFRTELHCLEN